MTWSYTNAAGTKISTAAVPFTVGGTTASSVAVSFDKSEYAIGDLVTMTLTVKDSKSNPVADGSYFLFDTTSAGAFTTSAQLTSAPFGTGVVSVVGGVATATFYAPYTTGEVAMSATMSSHSTVATAAQATKLAASITVGGADATASLALDAANAATDAANNAYDEAQNATQAASDALAAVTALAAQVKSLIASVKKLTAAVAKLKK
jgi:methyl-accepting chemotaxis protein